MAVLFAMAFIHSANIRILKQITANRISVLVGWGIWRYGKINIKSLKQTPFK
jgi:hypothetical protein